MINEMINEFLPSFRKLAGTEIYSITLAGSHGKGIADINSDFDFCIFYEKPASKEQRRIAYKEIESLIIKWKEKGIVIDGIWPRTYEEVENQLEKWIKGEGVAEPYMWTIWGYHFPTSIYNQEILDDPYERVVQWKKRLATYPNELKNSILNKHGESLKYWRQDYHYKSKVVRKDVVFLASITTRLIHDILQVVYALNEFYYPGDGANLKYTKDFKYKPKRLEERISEILHLTGVDDEYARQYEMLMELIDDALELV